MDRHPSKAEWIDAVLRRYEAPLLAYALRIVGDPDRARDVVQETFLNLCQARRSKVENHVAAWLFRVCRNRALDLRRKENRVEPLPEVTEDRLESQAPGPRAVAERREGTDQVLQIVETLPEKQREAIYLRFQSGLSYREISEITGHSVSNVGVLIHTAVRKIREHLTEKAAATAGAVKRSIPEPTTTPTPELAGGAR